MNATNPSDKSSHHSKNDDDAEGKLEHSNPLSAISSLKIDLKASEMGEDSGSLADGVHSSEEIETLKGIKKEDTSKSLIEEDDSDNDDEDEGSYANRGANPDDESRLKRRKRGVEEEVPMTFPQRLMEILSSDEHRDIISWLPHGRGFIIFQKKRFAAEIMPRYFKQSKFTSFTRKLNRWNFTRVTRGPETGAYYHEFFQKGNIRLCMQMCCQNTKNTQSSTLKQAQEMLSPGLMEARAVGDAISRLRLGSVEVGGMVPGNDFSMLQHFPFTGQGAQSAQPVMPGTGFAATREEQLLQLRQLEQQRDLLLQQQQQHLQHQQQQQQLAALLAGSSSTQGGSASQVAALLAAGGSVPQVGNASQGASDMSLGVLQRSNTNAYLAMLMAQEKMQAQMSAFGGGGQSSAQVSNQFSPLEFQRQQASFLQSQQQQLELYNQQRMLQAQLQQHQQEFPDVGLQQASDPTCNDLQQQLLNVLLQQQGMSVPGQDTSGGSEGNGGKISKRGASAA